MEVDFSIYPNLCKQEGQKPTEIGKIARMLAKYCQKVTDLGLGVRMFIDENSDVDFLSLYSPKSDTTIATVSFCKKITKF